MPKKKRPVSSTQKDKISFGQYMTLGDSALFVPLIITFIIICLVTTKGIFGSTLEKTLPGTAAVTADVISEKAKESADVLNATLKTVAVSKNTGVVVMDNSGKTVATNGASAAVPSSESTLLTKIRSGETGFGSFKKGMEKFYVAYSPVKDAEGWTVVITTPGSDFSGLYKTRNLLLIGFTLFFCLFGAWGIDRAVRFVSGPLTVCIKRLNEMAEGDFSSVVPDAKAHCYEVQAIRDTMEKMRSCTNAVIEDINYTLGEMANGNFAAESRIPERYVGDYKTVLSSENAIRSDLTQIIREILQISEQVSAGSEQVSNGAQSLAQGATEQASSIEQLSESIGRVAAQIQQSAGEAERANKITEESGQIMQSSADAMSQASAAMNEISETSRNISKVIKAIDDIAFQTNILALNAAVEAARAGAAGKGFAVVADEVRNLSQKSAEAAKNTTALIESSIFAVEKGGKLVGEASDDFTQVAEMSSQVSEIVATIYSQFQQQANETSTIAGGVEQVSSVIQMNSATSEESAAASEELSSQANVLRNLVSQFVLSDN